VLRPLDLDPRVLRARWRSASLAAGWRFPSDWGVPEVDMVCAALTAGGATESVLSALGRARAASGAGLEETLTDLAALHAVLAGSDGDGWVTPDIDATPVRLVRITATAWAEAALDRLANPEVIDPLTGLPTGSYLRTRLAEVYRAAARTGRPVPATHLLIVATVDASAMTGWTRLTGMILTADALRKVFDGGETVACLGPSTLAVLTGRDDELPRRMMAARREITARLSRDEQLHGLPPPALRMLRFPPTFAESCAVLSTVGRA